MIKIARSLFPEQRIFPGPLVVRFDSYFPPSPEHEKNWDEYANPPEKKEADEKPASGTYTIPFGKSTQGSTERLAVDDERPGRIPFMGKRRHPDGY